MEVQAAAHARSLYRSIMRELPQSARTAIKTQPSPLRTSIRNHFINSPTKTSPDAALARRQETEQAVQYLKAQRVYGALLERYNPGADMTEEDRVRLTARRVGMDMPEEWYGKGGAAGKFGGISWEKEKKKKD